MMTPLEITDQLQRLATSSNFVALSADLTDTWISDGIGFEAIEPTLRFMEENPSIEFGAPGPLVHFVERFFGNRYEEMLIESVNRKPTLSTVWMINRIINGTELPEVRRRMVAAMEQARQKANSLLDQNLMQRVDHFLERISRTDQRT